MHPPSTCDGEERAHESGCTGLDRAVRTHHRFKRARPGIRDQRRKSSRRQRPAPTRSRAAAVHQPLSGVSPRTATSQGSKRRRVRTTRLPKRFWARVTPSAPQAAFMERTGATTSPIRLDRPWSSPAAPAESRAPFSATRSTARFAWSRSSRRTRKRWELNIDHTLTNTGAITRTDVVLSRVTHMTMNNDADDDRGDKSVRSAWVRDLDAVRALPRRPRKMRRLSSSVPSPSDAPLSTCRLRAIPETSETRSITSSGTLTPGKKKVVLRPNPSPVTCRLVESPPGDAMRAQWICGHGNAGDSFSAQAQRRIRRAHLPLRRARRHARVGARARRGRARRRQDAGDGGRTPRAAHRADAR